jgi:hypothetical protein
MIEDTQIWTVTTAAAYEIDIQAAIDDDLGVTGDYDGTVDGAWTAGAGELAFRVDQGGALLLACLSVETAPPAVVTRMALERGLVIGEATRHRLRTRVTDAGAGKAGDTAKDTATQEWQILEAYTSDTPPQTIDITSSVDLPVGSVVIVEATTLGPVAQDSTGQSLFATGDERLTLPSGLEIEQQDQPLVIGRDAETAASIRARLRDARTQPGGSLSALRAGLMGVRGVYAVSILRVSGALAVTVAATRDFLDNPGTVALDDTSLVQIGQLLHDLKPAGSDTTGTTSIIVQTETGGTATESFTIGGTQSVTVSIALTVSGIDDADAMAAVDAAVTAVFSRLQPGDVLRWLAVTGAVSRVVGVTDAVITLDGLTGTNITPTLYTSILVPSITVGVP